MMHCTALHNGEKKKTSQRRRGDDDTTRVSHTLLSDPISYSMQLLRIDVVQSSSRGHSISFELPTAFFVFLTPSSNLLVSFPTLCSDHRSSFEAIEKILARALSSSFSYKMHLQ